MTKRITICFGAAALVLIFVLLTACASVPEAVAEPDIPEGGDAYLEELEAEPNILDNDDTYLEEPEVEPEPEPELYPPDEALEITISEESRIALRESIFVGEGERPIIRIDGDASEWYISPFGSRINGVSRHFMEIIGMAAWNEWREQWPYSENPREPFLITFIADSNITMGDIVRAQELTFGRNRNEIEELIRWGRYGIPPDVTNPSGKSFWAGDSSFSLSDLDVLFSGDATRIWERYPGYGVLWGGNVYTPEWILLNIERAVSEEQIPLDEIERIIERASQFCDLADLVQRAQAVLEN